MPIATKYPHPSLKNLPKRPPRNFLKHAKAVSPVSKKRKTEYLEWKRIEQEVIDEHPVCEACIVLFPEAPLHCLNKPSEGHHFRGRAGKLYTCKRFIMAVCRDCHDYIHKERRAAITLKLLAGPGEWGRQP